MVPGNAVKIVGGTWRHHSKELKRENKERERRRMAKGNPDVGVMSINKKAQKTGLKEKAVGCFIRGGFSYYILLKVLSPAYLQHQRRRRERME